MQKNSASYKHNLMTITNLARSCADSFKDNPEQRLGYVYYYMENLYRNCEKILPEAQVFTDSSDCALWVRKAQEDFEKGLLYDACSKLRYAVYYSFASRYNHEGYEVGAVDRKSIERIMRMLRGWLDTNKPKTKIDDMWR